LTRKALPDWYQRTPGVQSLSLDVSDPENCRRVCEGAVEVYNLAADMGGMGFIERFRIECLRSILINTHMVEAAYRAGASATSTPRLPAPTISYCNRIPTCAALKESDAYPRWLSAATAGRSYV